MNPVMEVGMPRDLELAPHKLGYTVAEAVALTGVSRTRLYQENKASRLKFVKIGRLRHARDANRMPATGPAPCAWLQAPCGNA
jgi:hypothetical protein